jgi:hypothetical protein
VVTQLLVLLVQVPPQVVLSRQQVPLSQQEKSVTTFVRNFLL